MLPTAIPAFDPEDMRAFSALLVPLGVSAGLVLWGSWDVIAGVGEACVGIETPILCASDEA